MVVQEDRESVQVIKRGDADMKLVVNNASDIDMLEPIATHETVE